MYKITSFLVTNFKRFLSPPLPTHTQLQMQKVEKSCKITSKTLEKSCNFDAK